MTVSLPNISSQLRARPFVLPAREPSAITAEVVSSLGQLPDATLDRITARSNVFFDRAWFRLIEAVDLPRVVGGNLELRYVVAREGGEPIAICPFLVTRSPSIHLFYSLEKFFFTPWWFAGVAQNAPDQVRRARWAKAAQAVCKVLARALQAGTQGWVLAVSPLSLRTDIAVADVPEERADAARVAIIAALQDVAADEGLPLCFLGLQEGDTRLRRALAAREFEEVFLSYDNVLDVDVASFDEYLGRFRSDARRVLGREVRRARDAGVRFERTSRFSELACVLDRLYENTSSRYGADHFRQPPEFWDALERHANARAEAVIAFDASGPVGFSLLLHKNGELWFHRVGRRYEGDQADAGVYFNLAFYEPVKRALELGAKRIWLGFGAWEAKRRRGAVPHAISSAFWYPRRWSRAVLHPYLEAFGRMSRDGLASLHEPSSYVKAAASPRPEAKSA